MPTSVRLDIETEQTLERLVRRKRTSKSAVLREAIEALAREWSRGETGGSLFERAEDLIGCVSGGTTRLSTRTGARFLRVLAPKGRR